VRKNRLTPRRSVNPLGHATLVNSTDPCRSCQWRWRVTASTVAGRLDRLAADAITVPIFALLLSSLISPLASSVITIGLLSATWMAGVGGGTRV
jgi:hypothetical protein